MKIAITSKVLIFTYSYPLCKFLGPLEVYFPIYSNPSASCLEISQSVTAFGRMMIEQTKNEVESM